jgi:uncharacterized membrane protein
MNTVTVLIDHAQKRSRLTALFRILLAIPVIIVAYVYELVTLIAVIIAWFALLITGRYPEGLYNFVAGFVRFYLRLTGYLFLAVDAYPPFSGADDPDYPLHVSIPERKDHYNRLLVLLRIPFAIPLGIYVYLLLIVFEILSVIAWFVIVIAGRLPSFIASYQQFTLGWLARVEALVLLLTESY